MIAATYAALALLHAAPASAATGPQKTVRNAAAAKHAATHAKKTAPTFHEDTTPLDPGVASAGTAKGQAPSAGSAGADVIRTIVGLAVVLGVIYGVYWLLKTYGKSKKQDAGDGRMEVVATTQLAPNRAMHLVKVGDELVLVGSGEQTITQLRVYDAEESRRLTDVLISPPDLRPLDGEEGGGSKGLTIGRLVDDLRRKTAR